MKTTAGLLALTLLASCMTPPRTTTEHERQTMEQTLLNIETALIALKAFDRIKAEDFALAMKQLGELREAVKQSATTPISWQSLVQQILNFAAAWSVAA